MDGKENVMLTILWNVGHARQWRLPRLLAHHLRESFAALAAGARTVPFWDNGSVHRSLALRLTEIRANPRGCAAGGTRSRRPASCG
jgi:hypothetical protein